jgi:hypothetical protein
MSRARHKAHKAKGGVVHWVAGEHTPEAEEAEEKRHGGKVHHAHGGGKVHGEGERSKHRADKRARGGNVIVHEVKGHSMHHKHGMSIPGRKRGGGVGADKMPLTEAAKVKHVTHGEQPEEGLYSD